MEPVHVAKVEERELLIQLVQQELKAAGIDSNFETPKPSKKTGSTPVAGRLFGRPLQGLSKLLISLDDNNEILVPEFVVRACTYIEEHGTAEGIYRMAGSAVRQRTIRREMEEKGTFFAELSPKPSVLDVANLLKQFLRELPLAVLPHSFHSFVKDLSETEMLPRVLLSLLTLPVENVSCLSYICRHLRKISSNSSENKMTPKNLAIVLTPSIFPIQAMAKPGPVKDRKTPLEAKPNHLQLHTAVIETLIQNAEQVGFLPNDMYEKLSVHCLGYSTCGSEDNLDNCLECGPSKRRSKKKRVVRRRSGSLSRVLSVMGKGIRAMTRSTTPCNSTSNIAAPPDSFHSTPFPALNNTPDFSPRILQAKRKASEHDEASPSKSQKGSLHSTFTPKMRTRTFSVKRFKRKKSFVKQQNSKESLIIHTDVFTNSPASAHYHDVDSASPKYQRHEGSSVVMTSFNNTRERSIMLTNGSDLEKTDQSFGEQGSTLRKSYGTESWDNNQVRLSMEYEDVKTRHEELKVEIKKTEDELSRKAEEQLENGASERLNTTVDMDSPGPHEKSLKGVEERYEEALAAGKLDSESRATARQMARVRRRSHETSKPRSPSERRIGALRRSRERRRSSQRRRPSSSRSLSLSPGRQMQIAGDAAREARHANAAHGNKRSPPAAKAALTPLTNLNRPFLKGKLQRGQPNSTSSGLERPSPLTQEDAQGRPRIKMSFNNKNDRDDLKVKLRIKNSDLDDSKEGNSSGGGLRRKSRTIDPSGNSITNLRDHLTEVIENSFGGPEFSACANSSDELDDDNVFLSRCTGDEPDAAPNQRKDCDGPVAEISNQIARVSFDGMDESITASTISDQPGRRRSSRMEESGRDATLVSSSSETLARRKGRNSMEASFEPPQSNIRDQIESGSIRRQSSAFEFLSRNVILGPADARNVSTRASIRRRNSSVRDLVQRLESEARKRAGGPVKASVAQSNVLNQSRTSGTTAFSRPSKPVFATSSMGTMTSSVANQVKAAVTSDGRRTSGAGSMGAVDANPASERRSSDRIRRKESLAKSDAPKDEVESRMNMESPSVSTTDKMEDWMDAKEFFRTAPFVEPSECGRSSVIRIRQEKKGLVHNSVAKFSVPQSANAGTILTTPTTRRTAGTSFSRPPTVPGPTSTRRMSARLGLSANSTTPAKTAPAAGTTITGASYYTAGHTPRKQTLTGIRTSVGGGGPRTRYSMDGGKMNHSQPKPGSRTPAVSHAPARESAATANRRSSVAKDSARASLSAKLAVRTPSRTSTLSTRPALKKTPPPSQPATKTVAPIAAVTTPARIHEDRVEPAKTGGSAGKKARSRRNGNAAAVGQKAVSKRIDTGRRYLTIGYTGEASLIGSHAENRNPLKDCQNIQANVKRSNSDQSQSRKHLERRMTFDKGTSEQLFVIPAQQENENLAIGGENHVEQHLLTVHHHEDHHLAAKVRRTRSEKSAERSSFSTPSAGSARRLNSYRAEGGTGRPLWLSVGSAKTSVFLDENFTPDQLSMAADGKRLSLTPRRSPRLPLTKVSPLI